MNAAAVRQIVRVTWSLACIGLALLSPQPTRARAPVCLDPITKKEIPCTPKPGSGGEGLPGSAETNGRLCLAAYDDLNFNATQDPGEPLAGGGQVKVINLSTGATTLADLLSDGPQCLFLPGGAGYHGEGILAPGYVFTGAGTFDVHLETSGTIQILFATSRNAPSPTATLVPATKLPTTIPTTTPTNTARPTFTETLTLLLNPAIARSTETATAMASATPTSTASGQVIAIVDVPPPPAPEPPQPPGVFWPWLAGVGLGLLTAGIAGAGLATAAGRMGQTYRKESQPKTHRFAYTHSPAQDRLIQPAFSSHKPSQANDQLRPAGPTPGQPSNNSQDYQFALFRTVPAFNPWRLWVNLGALSLLVIGGGALGAAGVLGLAGALPLEWWPVSGLGLIAAVLSWRVNHLVQTLVARWQFQLPEVDDEVLIAFEPGGIQTPFVTGALWNDKDSDLFDNKHSPSKRKPESDSDDKRHSRYS
jgi:Type VI secretion system/phage-baseplate injector OB domain